MEIPAWPHARPLEMADKALFDGVFEQLQPRISECTFAGLYLFRRAHDYRVSRVGDALVVMGCGYDGARYVLPPLTGDIPRALSTVMGEGIELYGADDAFSSRYLLGEGIVQEEDRNAFDYLYLREELAQLPGNRFHKKKNRINYFSVRHRYQVHVFSDVQQNGCLQVLRLWQSVAEQEGNRSLRLEVDAAAEAIEQAKALALQGVVVEVEGKVKGFALGELLNRETAVCHFEKCDPFMEGLPQLVNREFSRLLFPECRYINREQDLGEPGLRTAKLSYHPVELVRKFRARLSSTAMPPPGV